MKRLTTARTLAALLGCLLVFSAAGWGDSHARIVRLSYLQGPVDLDRGQGTGFERAILNMPLVEGAQLATRENGTAEVEFEDGSTLRLAPNSRVEFTALSLSDDGARLTTISLVDGTAYFDLQHMDKQDEFSIHL